ncbi:hypothetical protein V473_00715 [Sphingobium cupriresistens LL01]|uniref:TonB-dependent receptor-like beta-barrel domain-containing protein n=1 Tax=Sphingobium cupriresistens LL01 TaxID=1420583 RepID=A0A0J7Y475_9SPHN|nr:hypothetical protein V473_00715 [Sphingobium cupriresistens LL01]
MLKLHDFCNRAKNLFDQEYIGYGLSLESALGFNYMLRGVPRQFGAEATIRF